MKRIIVAGCGTDVGKTVVSAILATALEADYWKPIQSGPEPDTETVKKLIVHERIHPATYTLKAPLSPHHAARLENVEIDVSRIVPPITDNTLIIESVGGVMVPLTLERHTLDLFATWNATWIVVSKFYLGSINHTLLTLEALKSRHVHVHSIVFNGERNRDSEEAILRLSGIPRLGHLQQEKKININIIQRYAQRWKNQLITI